MAANVQSMCQYWKNFDLQDLQKHLDTTATDLANRQDESDISRKRLVEQSRDFKKNTPEEIRKVVGPLLRSFQAEVDALSKRSKAAEAAFLSVYKKLIDMPDPVPCLEHGIVLQKTAQRIESLELENKELLETLEDYNQDYPEAKIQEETIKELTAKLKDYDDQLEAKTEARFKEKEKEIQKTFDEKERLLQETQLTLSNKLGEAEQKVSALHSALESAQAEIQRQKAKYDEVVETKSSRSDAIKETSSENLRSDDMEMVIKDLERANERAEASEREVEQLRQQLASATQNLHQVEQMEKATDMEQALDILKRSRLEVELAAKDKEITQLIEDIQRLQASYDNLQESTSARITRLEENVNKKDKAFRLLEEMFRSQKEFEDIKRELCSMKSTEFTDVSDDDCPLETSNSLELLLLEKAKNQEQQQPAQPQQTSEAQPLNLTESDSTASNTNSTPLTTTTTEAFATMLGEELVTSYQQHNQSGSSTASTPTSNGLPPSSDNHPPPPSPHNHSSSSNSNTNNNSNSTTNHVPFSPSSTNCQMPPPPTSQFLSYGNGHSPATHHYMPPSVVVKQEPNSGTTTPSNGKNQSLDTALVAKMVRELLSVHNIGQRLFAKHILGLSQGTVSELLSKPKSWDKLTEKGRESYRKMHAWAVDESNILALKAISPKKTIKKQPSDGVLKEPYTKPAGSQALVPSSQREDSATEERITQILNAAQQAMQMKKSMDHTKNFTSIQHAGNKRSPPIAHDLSTNMSHQLQVSTSMALNAFKEHSKNSVSSSKASVSTTNGTSTVSSTGQSSPSHANMNSSSRNRSESSSSTDRKHGHKNLSSQSASSKERELAAKEMVTRIYREELTKLAQAAESAGNVAASTMYQQELARIAQNIHRSTPMQQQLHDNYHHQDNISIKTEPPDSTSDENSLQANGPIDLSKPHSSPQTPTTETTFADSGRHTGSAFCLVRPRLNGQDNYESSRFSSYLPSDCLSPLQRMQNIANSLTTRSHIGTPSTKPLKAVLPPITQEQFDKYSNIDTDILVKQVKETLSQYSISQRLFGENVLGLSQGSVSDLLARPKPWHMLTQKGREPFIRMQIFLEDGEAIPKLVASQYRIPPDKLMRNNSQNQESSSSAARRRRSSIDDRCFDAPTAPKRPRIFFTEEQKEILRQAYAQDPYPNQNTIEGLAAELNVGVKTVINWFHNHRMRAKQQQHPVSNSNSNSQGDGQFSVKTEPNEDSSNHSESSIISETAPDRSGDGGQWMFPKFEPVQRKTSTENSVDLDENNSEKKDQCSKDETSQDSVSKNNNNNNKVNTASMQTTNTSVVNKRKRANPQWVFEGTQLDKTHNQENLSKDDNKKLNNAELNKDLEENNDREDCELSKFSDRASKIQKLQKRISSADEEWEEFDRSASIEKIQKNLTASQEETWEF